MPRVRSFGLFAAGLMGVLLASPAQADTIIWGNSAGSNGIDAFNITSGGVATLLTNFQPPEATGQNGRGVAVLGNTLYYTDADQGFIYQTSANTSGPHVSTGPAINTGFTGIANVATDGTYIYATDYQTTSGVIKKYNTAGVFQGSITLGPPYGGAFSRDGFEAQNNPNINGGALTFIANRIDGGYGTSDPFGTHNAYDVYNADGSVKILNFLDPTAHGGTANTGVAYDGTNYYVSDIDNNRLLKFDGLGNFLGFIVLPANGNRFLEDLSAVGNTINNPPPGAPEPASFVMAAIGALGLAGYNLRRRKQLAKA